MTTTEIHELRIALGPAAEAVDRAGRRLADLVASVDDPSKPVKGLAWTLQEMAAHLSARTERFAATLSGEPIPGDELADMAAENEREIRARSARPLEEHVDALRSNVASFVGTTKGKLGADPFPWYPGVTVDVATGTGLLLAELLVHGFDVARTLDRRWPIGAADARTIVRASAIVAPHYVDRDTARSVRMTYRFVVKGGPTFRIRIEDGAATTLPSDGQAECTIRARPAALVLVSYGRLGPWRAALTGKLLASGRRPWRAATFDRMFRSP
ncbi:MAG: maleylpyruvate isomerase family mycothiol-dependent enzyme [Actinobacteria bacterium]|nr:maleylpyruvate isomerase family mycothiol-dependent enzyme [Actinomycetota bacterium]